MIKKATIKNFQPHKKSLFEFDPGVNIIVGSTDSGKSAVIRSLVWGTKNQPSGIEVRSWWGGDTSVEIETDEHSIERLRTNSFNGYVEGSQKFAAIKSDVPFEINEMFNITDVNIQQQLDSPFLLSETSGTVAKYFNKIANLEKIDTATAKVNQSISKLKSDITYKENDLEENVKKLEGFMHLSKFEIEVEVIENDQSNLLTKQSSIKKLEKLYISLENIAFEIEKFSNILSMESKLDSILELISKKKVLENDFNKLTKCIESLDLLYCAIENKSNLIPMGDSVDALILLYQKVNVVESNRDRLSKHIKNVKNNIKEIEIAENDVEVLHEEFETNFPSQCPLCGK